MLGLKYKARKLLTILIAKVFSWTPVIPCKSQQISDSLVLICDRYMMPDTLHLIVTVEDAITYGRHTFPASLSQQTALGIVHSFVLGYKITNQIHHNLNIILRRMMSMWFAHYSSHPTDDDEQTHHIPNMANT
jgi:hypothetical protein